MKRLLEIGTQTDKKCVIKADALIPDDHRYLFSFLDQKETLKGIEDTIKAYVKDQKTDVSGLLSEMESLHPYFKKNNEAAAFVLDCTLAKAVWSDHDILPENMHSIFSARMFGKKEGIPSNLEYYLRGNIHEDIADLLDCLHTAALFVSVILDDSNKELKKLSSPVRMSLYALAARYSDDIKDSDGIPVTMNLPIEVTLPYSEELKMAEAVMDFDDEMKESVTAAADQLIKGSDSLPDSWKHLASLDTGKKTHQMEEVYKVKTFSDLIRLELFFMVQENTRVNRCQTCGRLFAVRYKGQIYCDYPQEGSSHYRTKEYSRIYNREYKTRFARVKRNTSSQEDLEEWKKKALAVKNRAEKLMVKPSDFEEEIREI